MEQITETCVCYIRAIQEKQNADMTLNPFFIYLWPITLQKYSMIIVAEKCSTIIYDHLAWPVQQNALSLKSAIWL